MQVYSKMAKKGAFLSNGQSCMKYHTVEPPNKGQVGTSTDLHYLEVVLYWFFLSKILYFTFYDILGRVLLLCGYKVGCVRVRKIL